jgi:hypothetical protein
MKRLLLASMAVAALSGAAGITTAHAGPGWEFTSAGNSYSNGSWDFGVDFQVNTTVILTGLGYYADPNNGFVDSNPVALYDSSGQLLASAIVSNVNPLTGHFRYVTVAPVVLTPGIYQLDGVSNADNYTWDDVDFTTASAITYLGNYWYLNPPGATFQTRT